MLSKLIMGMHWLTDVVYRQTLNLKGKCLGTAIIEEKANYLCCD